LERLLTLAEDLLLNLISGGQKVLFLGEAEGGLRVSGGEPPALDHREAESEPAEQHQDGSTLDLVLRLRDVFAPGEGEVGFGVVGADAAAKDHGEAEGETTKQD
jgi:hypothetical protein